MAAAMEVKEEEQHVDPKVAFLLQRCSELGIANEQLQAKINEYKSEAGEELSLRKNTTKTAVVSICQDVKDYMRMVETFQMKIGATPRDLTREEDDECNLDTLMEEISKMTFNAKKGLSEVTKDWEGVWESVKDVMDAATKMIIHKIIGKAGPSNPKAFDFRI